MKTLVSSLTFEHLKNQMSEYQTCPRGGFFARYLTAMSFLTPRTPLTPRAMSIAF
jgi:hypothetical protein